MFCAENSFVLLVYVVECAIHLVCSSIKFKFQASYNNRFGLKMFLTNQDFV